MVFNQLFENRPLYHNNFQQLPFFHNLPIFYFLILITCMVSKLIIKYILLGDTLKKTIISQH